MYWQRKRLLPVKMFNISYKRVEQSVRTTCGTAGDRRFSREALCFCFVFPSSSDAADFLSVRWSAVGNVNKATTGGHLAANSNYKDNKLLFSQFFFFLFFHLTHNWNSCWFWLWKSLKDISNNRKIVNICFYWRAFGFLKWLDEGNDLKTMLWTRSNVSYIWET